MKGHSHLHGARTAAVMFLLVVRLVDSCANMCRAHIECISGADTDWVAHKATLFHERF